MKRRKAREYALQALFRLEFTGETPDDKTIEQMCEDKDPELLLFYKEIVKGVLEHQTMIDLTVQSSADNWSVERMATVDRIILRIGAFELLHRNDIPTAVAINEAIEIAKKYSTKESASFINGVLDKLSKKR